MSLDAKILGAAAAPHAFPFEGKDYVMKPITWSTKVAWQKHILKGKVKELEDTFKGTLPPEMYNARLNAIITQYDRGDFKMERMLTPEYLSPQNPEGLLEFACFMVDATPDTVVRILQTAPAEFVAYLQLMIKECSAVPPEVKRSDPTEPGLPDPNHLAQLL